MKLRNKKTGEIVTLTLSNDGETFIMMNERMYTYSVKLSDLDEWEDYEEPKEYWAIDEFNPDGLISKFTGSSSDILENRKSIGNYFETKEEAERAVEKLKAWKQLKDMGFIIEGIRYRDNKNYIEWSISQKVRDDHFMIEAFNEALHLLFGGEE